jgi:hypothetical protein
MRGGAGLTAGNARSADTCAAASTGLTTSGTWARTRRLDGWRPAYG